MTFRMQRRWALICVGLVVWIALLAGAAAAGEVLRFKINPPPQVPAPAATEDGAGNAETENEPLKTIAAPTEPADLPTDRPAAASVEPEAPAPQAERNASPPPERRFVRVEMGNIRQAPGKEEAALFLVIKGQRVVVKESLGGWCLIETEEGQSGWGHKSLFTKMAPDMTQGTGKPSMIRAIRTAGPGTVIVDLNGRYQPRTSVIEGATPRVVCDFYGHVPAADLPARRNVGDGIVAKVRVGLHAGDVIKTRLVVDLVPGRNYRIDDLFSPADLAYILHISVSEGESPASGQDAATAETDAAPPSDDADKPERLFVKVFRGNVRRSPNHNQDADVAFVVKQGQAVVLKETQGRWYRIETEAGQQGWCYQSLFSTTPPEVDSAPQ